MYTCDKVIFKNVITTLAGKHSLQSTDDVLQNCTLETYVILLTSVTDKFSENKA